MFLFYRADLRPRFFLLSSLLAEKRCPELEPWLDLSFSHTITYLDTPGSSFEPDGGDDPLGEGDENQPFARRLHLTPNSSPGRLSIHTLHIIVKQRMAHVHLSPFFDPVVFKVEGIELPPSDEEVVGEVSLLEGPDVSGWSRLQEMFFIDSSFRDILLFSGFRHGRLGPKIRLTYDIRFRSTRGRFSTISGMIFNSKERRREPNRSRQWSSISLSRLRRTRFLEDSPVQFFYLELPSTSSRPNRESRLSLLSPSEPSPFPSRPSSFSLTARPIARTQLDRKHALLLSWLLSPFSSLR